MKIILSTLRLTLAEATIDDADFILKLLNSPNWLEFIGDRGVKSTKTAADYITNSLLKSYQSNGYGLYKMLLKSNAQPIGLCGFVKRDYLDHPDIGFAILPEHEGNGYTTEAALATISFGKLHLNLKTVFGITNEENLKSRSILSTIGLKEIGKTPPNEKQIEFLLYSTS
ncbi:MAG: ribosomal-protein-alanine N-acetyltransferase [Marinoscillum sp.]|jgi:ribosomal-protein-alanine N-acetyltransferase